MELKALARSELVPKISFIANRKIRRAIIRSIVFARFLRSLALSLLLAGTAGAQQAADTIYHNGNIVTMWADHPVVEAVAIRQNRFLAIGTTTQVRKKASPNARQIDLHGRTVLPGLEDSHTHPIMAALSEQDRPVPVMNSIAEIQAQIRKLAVNTPPDRLIFLPKVYSTRLTNRRYPTRYELDQAAPGTWW